MQWYVLLSQPLIFANKSNQTLGLIMKKKKKSTLCNFDRKSQKIRNRRRRWRKRTLIFWNKVLIQPSDVICLILMAIISTQRWRSVLVSSTMERSMMPSFDFGPNSMGMASWWDWFSVLGFWEGEGREIEKREERQGSEGSAFWRKKKAGVVFFGF